MLAGVECHQRTVETETGGEPARQQQAGDTPARHPDAAYVVEERPQPGVLEEPAEQPAPGREAQPGRVRDGQPVGEERQV